MKKNFATREIIRNYRAMVDLMGSEIKLPGKVLWNMRLNRKELEVVIKTYEECINEIQKEFIADGKYHDTTDENGNTVTMIKPEFQTELFERIFEIESQITEVNIRTIPFEYISDVDFTGKQWMGIEFMLEEESEN